MIHRTLLAYVTGLKRPCVKKVICLSETFRTTNVCRYSAHKRFETPRMLSDIEDYVKKDFTLSDLKQKLNSDLAPTKTKRSTLNSIATIHGVLEDFEETYTSGTLLPEEIRLYFAALIKKSDRCVQFDNEDSHCGTTDKWSPDVTGGLHSNICFQILLKEAIVASSALSTYYLSQFFAAFVKLGIPPLSNTMLLLTSRIEERINEMFPSEVLTCLRSIRILEKSGLSCMDPLREGLLMHLENQLLDPPTFERILKSTPISERMSLVFYNLSDDLASFIYTTVRDTALNNPGKALRDQRDADSLLRILSTKQNPKQYLLRIVQIYFSKNPHELTEEGRTMILDIKNVISSRWEESSSETDS